MYEKLDKIKLNIPKLKRDEGYGWIYFLFSSEEIVYIGQTVNDHPMARIGAHFNDKEFDSFSCTMVELEYLTKTEYRLIREYKPIYNKSGIVNNMRSIEPTNMQCVMIEKESDFILSRQQSSIFLLKHLEKMGHCVDEIGIDDLCKIIPKYLNLKWANNTRGYLKSDLVRKSTPIFKKATK